MFGAFIPGKVRLFFQEQGNVSFVCAKEILEVTANHESMLDMFCMSPTHALFLCFFVALVGQSMLLGCLSYFLPPAYEIMSKWFQGTLDRRKRMVC